MLSLVFVRSLPLAQIALWVSCGTLEYDEVACVCSKLKMGVTGLCIDYEHMRFVGPTLWRLLFELYQNFYENGSVCESLKTGVILLLLKGKGAKANNKDNCRGITLFTTLRKIYEMVLLNRLENYAKQNRLFSNLQFGFQEGVGCIETSFTILETINHTIERGNEVFGVFLDVRKAFHTVWIDGLLYKLFSEFDIRCRMWLAIKDLYTEDSGQVLYSSTLSRKSDISQGTGQGRILAPFMYKVYINSLLDELKSHCYAISINRLSLPSPSFSLPALLALYPTFLTSLMGMCYEYSTQWRYEFNHTKSGVVTYGKTKPAHFEEMKEREWNLGGNTVDELYEYKNLGVLKNYIDSLSSNVEDNIDKTRTKAGMIFSSNFDYRKVNPFIYIKFWSQACLPSLLYGSELTPSLLPKLERCEQRFLKNIFYVTNFAPVKIILKLSGLNPIESEIALIKLLLLGRMITENKLMTTVRNLFHYQVDSVFDESISSLGILPTMSQKQVSIKNF